VNWYESRLIGPFERKKNNNGKESKRIMSAFLGIPTVPLASVGGIEAGLSA